MTDSLDDLRAAHKKQGGMSWSNALIEALEAENAELKAELADEQEAGADKLDENIALREQIRELKLRLTGLKADAVAADARLNQLEGEVGFKDHNAKTGWHIAAAYRDRLDAAEKTVRDRDARITESEADGVSLYNTIAERDALREQVRELEAESADTQARLRAFDAEVKKAWASRDAWKDKAVVTANELREQQELLAAANDENVTMLAVLQALQPFWDQCQRGESENPQRYQETYLALDAEIRKWAGVRDRLVKDDQ